jgi:hypothetical protein
MTAAQTIFLWLCRRRLHVWLARQTSRRQQREAALARLGYKQDCCSRAALTEEQCWQAAAAQAKALANKADRRHRQDALAVEQRRQELDEHAVAMAESALAEERRCRELAERAATLAELALAEDENDDDVAWWIEAYAAPFFACVDAVMVKIWAMDDGFSN